MANELVLVIFGLFSRHLSTLIAAFILFLGYRLVRIGMEKAPSAQDNMELGQYLQYMIPGTVFTLVGIFFIIIFEIKRDPLSLELYLLMITVLVGFGFAILGWRLFVQGVFQTSDVETAWHDKKLIIQRAAPETLYSLFGLIMISIALWMGPKIIGEYKEIQSQSWDIWQRVIDEGVQLLDRYLQEQR